MNQQDAINREGLRSLAQNDAIAQKAFTLLAQRQRKRSATTVDVMMRDLDAPRTQIVSLFKGLMETGCGRMIIGRGSKPTRFIWAFTMASVAQYALGQSDALEPMPATQCDQDNVDDTDDAAATTDNILQSNQPVTIPDAVTGAPPAFSAGKIEMLSHNFPLRPGLLARLSLPVDLTTQEAERLAAYIRALAVPPPGASQ